MITVRSKPQHFNAHQWDGIATKLDDNIEIVILETMSTKDNLLVGAVIKDAKPIANVVQGHWIVFNHVSMQIIEDDTFRAQFVEYVTVDAEWTTIALLTPPQSNE